MSTWIKEIKNSTYFSRFQVQFRRRRDGLTDYQQRRNMIRQDKDKYETPKYRLVVRRSNQYTLAQIVSSRIGGDHVIAAASSAELTNYGVKVGLNNFAACYCTGLLVARRALAKMGLDKIYAGNTKVGNDFNVDDQGDRRSFRCFLDIGLARTSSGANIFGALKGAVDGGLNIPHGIKRFPGFKNDKLDSKILTDRIYAQHVSSYYKDHPEHFALFQKAGVKPDDIKPMYEKAHQAIRANPASQGKKKDSYSFKSKGKPGKTAKHSLQVRKSNLDAKKKAAIAKLMK